MIPAALKLASLSFRRIPWLLLRRTLCMDSNKEQELFSVNAYRWLYNDKKQRSVRYVPFNVEAFLDTAVRSAGATRCTSLEKVQDGKRGAGIVKRVSVLLRAAGTMNRVFSLRFDNDTEFIAKVPFPVAGPKHYCIASEVATLDFLRTELGIPVPHVRAWCSRAESTPVGVEYIMYDKIPGVQLYKHDDTELPVEDDPYVQILSSLLAIEGKLARVHFSQIGSIYYKEDVLEALRDRSLYATDIPPTANSSRFCIGPTTDREFWRAGRAHLDIDRGPWQDVRSYMFALAACARASLDALPSNPVHDEYRQLISDYEKLVPHIAPNDVPYALWHPDLHAGNILVTETADPCELKGIIDWQGALVAPYYSHVACPPAYTAEDHPLVEYGDDGCPKLAAGVDALDDKRKQQAERACRRAWRQKVHEFLMYDHDPILAMDVYSYLGIMPKRYITSPVVAITRGLSEGLVFIRLSFVRTRTLWSAQVGVDENGAQRVPFPLDISDADAERIEEAWQSHTRDAAMCNELLERLDSPLDSEGLVDAGEYEAARRAVEEAKHATLEAAPTVEERERIAKAWPLQDGKVSLTAEVCC